MVCACSIDTSILFALTKKETPSTACKNFIDNTTADLLLCESVEREYHETINYKIGIWDDILRSVGKVVSKETKYSELRDIFENEFPKWRQGRKKSTQQWITFYEHMINGILDEYESADKNIIEFLCDVKLHKNADYKRLCLLKFDQTKKKCKCIISDNPKPDIYSRVNNFIENENDARHITNSVEYGAVNDKWVFLLLPTWPIYYQRKR